MNLSQITSAFRTRLKTLLFQAGFARLIIIAIALFIPALAFDWLARLSTAPRAAILAAYLCALAATLYFTLLKPLARKWTDAEILRHLDASGPERGMLMDLFELQRSDTIQSLDSPLAKELAESARASLEPKAHDIKIADAFEHKNIRRSMLLAGTLLIVLAIAGVLTGDYLAIGAERFFNPFSKRRWPSRTVIALNPPPDGFQVPQMESFTLQAAVTGVIPAEVQLAYKSASTGYYIKERLAVRPDGRVEFKFPEVREPLDFYLSGGDDTTDTMHLAVAERPYLKRVTAQYKYPDYAGLPDATIASGQLAGLEGTQVRLEFESSLPLKRAVFAQDKNPPEDLVVRASSLHIFEKTLMLREDGAYAIELHDTHGFREARPERYEIRVTPDSPPEADLLAPGRDLVATRNFSVEVAFKARDDFGLKSVELLYSLNDAAPVALSDRVTGPIKQSGRSSEARFTWDLRKLENIPESASISYFLRVQDINPTGRGKVETARRQIRLVKPSDFQLETLENGKGLLTEALIAWRNQLDAWRLNAQFSKTGTGADDDPVWRDLGDKQDSAIRAAKAMSTHLAVITQALENNHMQREFMAAHLNSIAELLQRLTEKEHVTVAGHLHDARPKSDADSSPAKLKTLRTTALSQAQTAQKLSVLILERLLRKCYDWRDLQTTTITAALLHERQEDVGTRTEQVSPKYIGKEFEDLTDPEQEQLLTLGKQQRAIFDTETQLEAQLAHQIFKAEKQGRKSIHVPLRAAFDGLRANRVNDNLKAAASKIENNQPSVIIQNQKAALRALEAVKTGLILAGQKLDPDEPLDANMAVSEAAKFEEAEVAKDDKKEEPSTDAAKVDALQTQPLESVLPEGGDTLSTAIRLALERQDDVLARTRYMAQIDMSKQMPRFNNLKFGMLRERQLLALKELDRALAESGKTQDARQTEFLAETRDALHEAYVLFCAYDVSPLNIQIQDDGMVALRDTLQHIAYEKAVEESAAENKRRNGLDAFQRQFLLRDRDLALCAEMLRQTGNARLLERDIARRLARIAAFPAKPPADGLAGTTQFKIEATTRSRAKVLQDKVATLLAAVRTQSANLSPETAARVHEAGLDAILNLKFPPVAEIAAGGKDKENAAIADEAARTLGAALQSLRDLLEERVQLKATAAAQKSQEEPKKISAEEYAKSNSREALLERIKMDTSLPPAIREKMLQSLTKEFPAQFKQLLTAYYASFGAQAEEKKETKP